MVLAIDVVGRDLMGISDGCYTSRVDCVGRVILTWLISSGGALLQEEEDSMVMGLDIPKMCQEE